VCLIYVRRPRGRYCTVQTQHSYEAHRFYGHEPVGKDSHILYRYNSEGLAVLLGSANRTCVIVSVGSTDIAKTSFVSHHTNSEQL
jgi:hypothetical protein